VLSSLRCGENRTFWPVANLCVAIDPSGNG
jgi:hypothetical protein